MSEIKLLISDVDGTLVTPEKKLTPKVKAAVFELGKAGCRFTLSSSRPPYGLLSMARTLEVKEPMASFNGGLIVTPQGKPIRQYLMLPRVIPLALACFEQFNVFPRLYTATDWYIHSSNQPYAEHEAFTVEREPTVTQDFSPYFSQVLKLTGVSEEPHVLSQCQKTLETLLKGQASVVCSQAYYLDVTHPLANKGHVVKLLSALQQVPQAHIAVIGDMPSDVPMFQKAGFSIAMGNAEESVKQKASYVTDTNTQEGFAKAMENTVLKGCKFATEFR